jgi:hypothetical protein
MADVPGVPTVALDKSPFEDQSAPDTRRNHHGPLVPAALGGAPPPLGQSPRQ